MKTIPGENLAVLPLGWTLAAGLGLLVPALMAASGCRQGAVEPAQAEPKATVTPSAERSSPAAEPSAPAAPQQEIWEAICIRGVRIGYQRTTIRAAEHDGRPAVAVEGYSRLVLRRDAAPTCLEVRFNELETRAGDLLEYDVANPMMKVRGRVSGDVLEMTIETTGKRVATKAPWKQQDRGVLGVQQSLRQRPMKPGERRSVSALDSSIGQVIVTDLSARDEEETAMYPGKARLLRIEACAKIQDQTIPGIIWCDAVGEVLKTRMDLLGEPAETFRVPKEVALAETPPQDVELDVVRQVSVPVSRTLAAPHATRRIRYHVRLEGGDPAREFPSGPSQQVKALRPDTAEITVYAIRPGGPSGNPQAKDDPPTKDDRAANNLIQSDDPLIVAAAEKAAGGQKDDWEAVRSLERFVREWITEKDYSRALDSAADVIRSHRGDCTEHAVLLAALVRARGLPARAAIGLVYQNGAFLYHMWTEVYLSGRWIAVDGTLARGGIGAAHLKLAHSNLVGASAYSAMLPVMKVARKLKIEIVEVE